MMILYLHDVYVMILRWMMSNLQDKTKNSKAAELALKVLQEHCSNYADHIMVSLTILCAPYVINDLDYDYAHNSILELIENGTLEEAFNAIKVGE
jgi:hypothetical protein